MKKYIYSAIAALIAFACTDPFQEEQSLPIQKVVDPTIEVIETGETTIKADIKPVAGTSFYSYAVIAGPAAQLDSASLFKLGYKSKAVVYGTVDYSKADHFEVVAGSAEKPLNRDADYTIYAVAASEQGYIGSIVYTTVHTGDSQVPTAKPAAKGNVVTFTFSEKVSYDNTKAVTASYYAENLVTLNEDKDALATDGKKGDAKAVVALADDGKSATATVTLADGSALPAGAIFAVSYPAGTFKDSKGNAIAALTSGPVANNGKVAWAGAVGQIDTKAFDIVDDDAEAETVAPSTTNFTYGFPEGVELFDLSEDATVTMTVVKTSATVSSEAVYTLTLGTDWGVLASGKPIIMYPAAIDITGGDNLTIAISEGAFIDIYGNESKAFTHEYLYSYGYTIADLTGTYSYVGADVDDGTPHTEDAVVIAPDPENENGILIYRLFDSMPNFNAKYFTTWEPTKEGIKGEVNFDTGEIAIDKCVVITAESAAYTGAYGYSGTFSAAFYLQAPEAGLINTAWRYYLDGTNYYMADEEGVLTRTSSDYVVPSDPGDDPGDDPIQITIDGDLSDWEAVEGTTNDEAVYCVLKAFADDDNIYLLSKRTRHRDSELWGSTAGYYYYDFDLDNDAETGDYTEGSNGKFEASIALYLFGGSQAEPEIKLNPNYVNDKGMTADNIVCKGVITDNDVTTELSIPRANLPAIANGQTIRILSWGNKDANKMQVSITVGEAAASGAPQAHGRNVTPKLIR